MLTLTPAERAAHRVSYMHSLAKALTEGDTLKWRTASISERAEVSAFLTRAEISFPNDFELEQIEQRRLLAALKAAIALAKLAMVPKRKAASSGKEALTK